MNEESIPEIMTELKRVKSKARMTAPLEAAIVETIKALSSGNIVLARDVSAVKSYIHYYMGTKGGHFGEDAEYNTQVLGDTVYAILDNIHYQLSMKTMSIPSGMVEHTAGGTRMANPYKTSSPTIRQMRKEQDAIQREIDKKYGKVT
jgi:hypothetical protein